MKPIKIAFSTLMIAAVAASAVVALLTLWFSESTSIDSRYDKTRDRLLRARKDGEPDSLSPGALLRELNEILDQKYDGDAPGKAQRRQALARDFARTFAGQSFDYGQGSNVELETTVFVNWDEYREYLTANPGENVWLLQKYADALEELGQRDPDFVRTVSPRPDGTLDQAVGPKNRGDAALIQKLSVGYQKHVALLRATPGPVNKEYLLSTFCWYRNATNNPSLTAHVFSYDPTQTKAEEARCADTRQSPKFPG